MLLEPPRPTGLPSGGFRYQERIVAALGCRARRVEVEPDELHRSIRLLQHGDPAATVLVDGWFVDLTGAALPAGVVALLHMAPSRQPWCTQPIPVVATGRPTADAVKPQAASVRVVRPGIDACFRPLPRRGDPTFAIVTAGTICAAKGQRRLVAALRSIDAPWRLTIVGSTDQDPDEVDALRQETDGLPVEIRDAVDPEELAAIYAEHDLYVSMSRSESYGMAAAEAAAAGLPLLGLRTGELATLAPEPSRWLLNVDADASDVCRALRQRITQPQLVRAERGMLPLHPRSWDEAATELIAAIRAWG